MKTINETKREGAVRALRERLALQKGELACQLNALDTCGDSDHLNASVEALQRTLSDVHQTVDAIWEIEPAT